MTGAPIRRRSTASIGAASRAEAVAVGAVSGASLIPGTNAVGPMWMNRPAASQLTPPLTARPSQEVLCGGER